MTCDDAKALLIDTLATPSPLTDAALLAHLESCAACRGACDDYQAMWRRLGDLVIPQPAAGAHTRFAHRLATTRLSATRWSRPAPWFVGGLAAAVLIAALAGYALGLNRSTERARVVRATPGVAQETYLILLHVDSTFHHGETPAASAAIVAEYGRWIQGLPATATLVSTASLTNPAIWLGPPLAPSTNGDHVAGFFMIRARDRAEATRIAATCPHLKYGGRIELRIIK